MPKPLSKKTFFIQVPSSPPLVPPRLPPPLDVRGLDLDLQRPPLPLGGAVRRLRPRGEDGPRPGGDVPKQTSGEGEE